VPAAAAKGPEQVLVLLVAGDDRPAVGGDDVDRQQVVEREAEAAGQVADAAAQGEAGDSRGRHDAARRGQAVGVGGVVEVAPGAAALGAGGLRVRVDADAFHGRQVDDDAVVVGAEAGDAVAAAAHGQVEPVLAGEVHSRHNVAGIDTADDDPRTAVDHAVVDASCLVVVGVVGGHHLAACLLAQLLDRLPHTGPPSFWLFRRAGLAP